MDFHLTPITTVKHLGRTANLKEFNEVYVQYSAAILGVLVRDIGDKAAAETCLITCFVQAWNDWNTNGPTKEKIFIWLLRIAKKEVLMAK